jgi:uncharacterized membrane protein YkoI
MFKSIYKASALTLLSLSLFSVSAQADYDDMHEIEAVTKQFGLISLDEAKDKAIAARAGVVTDMELENRKFSKGWDYEFEIVDADGHEWDVNIDAKTGNVTKNKRDWF